MIALVAGAALLMAALPVTDLTALEAEVPTIQKLNDWTERERRATEHNQALVQLVKRDALKSGSDWLRAANAVIADNNWYEFERLHYEWTLTALAMGEPGARQSIGSAWDQFMLSLARRPRLGALPYSAGMPAKYAPELTLACIRAALTDSKSPDKPPKNAQLAALRDADQKARQTDWSKLTQAQIIEIAHADEARRAQALDILRSAEALSGEDFEAAGLLLQHGDSFGDYALAHELSVCAVVQGYAEGIWLMSRSYDRMLLSAGYRQRFLTQFGGVGVRPYETTGVNDRQLKALKTLTVKEAIARGKQIASGKGW